MIKFHGLNKLSLVDYPEHMSAILFTGHCNFRCPFCHNSSLVLDPESQGVLDNEEILSFLRKRKNMLDGVVITGGEPTVHEDLLDFIKQVKELGYLVKLDTNGALPSRLGALIDSGCIDYIAMDIKNSLDAYPVTIGVSGFDTGVIETSVRMIKESGIDYEFRTTVVRELHYEENFEKICALIAPCSRYFLQTFVPSEDTIRKNLSAPDKDAMKNYLKLVRNYITDAYIRDSRD